MGEVQRDLRLISASEWTVLPKPKKGWRLELKIADLGLTPGDRVNVIARGATGLQLLHGDAVSRAIESGGVQRLAQPISEHATLTFLVSAPSKQAAPDLLALYVIKPGHVSACTDALLPRCGASASAQPPSDPGMRSFETDMPTLEKSEENEMISKAARALLVSTEDSTALSVATTLGRTARHQTPDGLIDLMLHLGSVPTKN